MRAKARWAPICALSGLVAAVAHAGAPDPDATARATMQRVFAAMSVLLPASAKQGGFADPARKQDLTDAFAALRSAAVDLRAHGTTRDASFSLHARDLADDALNASNAFALGDEEEARFAFTLMTQRCVDCHSRLPYLVDSPLSARLVALPEVQALAPLERARVDVAVRRFDEALATWEEAFADPKIPPAQHEMSGTLSDYLTIALRVKGDAKRPQPVLRALMRRKDTPEYLRNRLVAWSVSLANVGPELAQSTPHVQKAREWAMMARNLSDLPTARDGLVYDLAASSLLLRWVDAREKERHAAGDLELATAYYELAVIEDRTAFSIWAPRTDVYMEAAIRAAPAGPLAKRAYARVEEQLLSELGATDPDGLPEPERARLTELRRLVEGGAPPAKPKQPPGTPPAA